MGCLCLGARALKWLLGRKAGLLELLVSLWFKSDGRLDWEFLSSVTARLACRSARGVWREE